MERHRLHAFPIVERFFKEALLADPACAELFQDIVVRRRVGRSRLFGSYIAAKCRSSAADRLCHQGRGPRRQVHSSRLTRVNERDTELPGDLE